MRYALTTAAAAAALILAAPVGAHLLEPGCNTKLKPRAELSCAKRNRDHAQATVAWALHEKQRVLSSDRSSLPKLNHLIRDHRWLARVMVERIAEAKRRLAVSRAGSGHYAGWACITNGAYPGAPHEGNGYNGSYTGPLGMSTPWAGHSPPASDWVHTPVSAVYAIAEQEAARHGFSYSWMVSQWPSTYPPCSARFR